MRIIPTIRKMNINIELDGKNILLRHDTGLHYIYDNKDDSSLNIEAF